MRGFDLLLAALGILVFLPLMAVIYVIGLFDTGRPLFFQTRVGRHQKPFTLIKFRTMGVNTDSVATHLAEMSSVTKLGGFLRRTKLDELPQLFNVLFGQMSLVGPRPCLFNQTELVDCRAERGIYDARPGITGLAQVNDVDMSTPEKLARYDALMLKHSGLCSYFYYIFATVLGRGQGDRVKSS
ncbi:MAG: lipid carrier--UDP-N-acetylgalactosaminyltransferase [Gammaproteobacteria bacterium]|nr:MAG: lipid carrier--UDP-N-acetylgalactosaminyltransferase [Gammaproteobacteria bacterium]